MRKIIISLSLMILIVIGCSQKPGQRFVFSPEKPLAGQKISVAYNPTTTPLEKADQVQIVVYEFSNSMTPMVTKFYSTMMLAIPCQEFMLL